MSTKLVVVVVVVVVVLATMLTVSIVASTATPQTDRAMLEWDVSVRRGKEEHTRHIRFSH
jgi:hypothetical protein